MTSRLDRLQARRTDAFVTNARLQNEVYRHILQSESVRYAIGAMQPIDPEYTRNTYQEGDRIRNQLEKRLAETCDFEYQGSVTNETHIKARSDIDLLVITGKFWTLEPPQQSSCPYPGDPIADLKSLRRDAKICLTTAFPEAEIDDSGAKSIRIEGGSLRRKVDVVPANWFDTNDYKKKGNRIFRGVQILDVKAGIRIKNTPFLHNAWIEYKDSQASGRLRMAARLMKSLKYDAEAVDLSSYDIVSLVYNISNDLLSVPSGQELMLVDVCREFCRQLETNQRIRDSLDVPDGHRKIFAQGHATLKGLSSLRNELDILTRDILSENSRSFRRLAEARVDY